MRLRESSCVVMECACKGMCILMDCRVLRVLPVGVKTLPAGAPHNLLACGHGVCMQRYAYVDGLPCVKSAAGGCENAARRCALGSLQVWSWIMHAKVGVV